MTEQHPPNQWQQQPYGQPPYGGQGQPPYGQPQPGGQGYGGQPPYGSNQPPTGGGGPGKGLLVALAVLAVVVLGVVIGVVATSGGDDDDDVAGEEESSLPVETPSETEPTEVTSEEPSPTELSTPTEVPTPTESETSEAPMRVLFTFPKRLRGYALNQTDDEWQTEASSTEYRSTAYFEKGNDFLMFFFTPDDDIENFKTYQGTDKVHESRPVDGGYCYPTTSGGQYCAVAFEGGTLAVSSNEEFTTVKQLVALLEEFQAGVGPGHN